MPSKSRFFVSLGVIFVVAAVSTGGYFLFNNVLSKNNKPQKINLSATKNSKSKSSTGNTAGTFSANGTNSSQLDVSPNSSSSANSTNSSSSSSNSSGQTAEQILNPANFAQYNKYLNASSTEYINLLEGSGTQLSAGHEAAVYYKGWLTNGKLFDQSQTKNGQMQPFDFTLGAHQVIPGWEEGVDGMKVGGVRLLIIPPSLGYGASGQGPIPGNSVLVFQVQLAAVK